MGEKIFDECLPLQEKIETLVRSYEAVSKVRDRRLFTEFLVTGYKQTTLSSVSVAERENVIFAKVCLGMLITLYDDLADNPLFYNPTLLKYLYQLNVGGNYLPYPSMCAADLEIYDLARHLYLNLQETICYFTNYSSLIGILSFDIRQVNLANQYSELITANPSMRNMTESKRFGPYNMGMVAAAMIDLMASPLFDMQDLGRIREILIRGQRLGRIGNLISTYERELKEGDITNEILLHPEGPLHYKKILVQEFYEGLSYMKNLQCKVMSVELNSYIDGLTKLYYLHASMEGII